MLPLWQQNYSPRFGVTLPGPFALRDWDFKELTDNTTLNQAQKLFIEQKHKQ